MAGFPILTYHSLDPSGSLISTHPDVFAAQIEALAARGTRTLTASELLDAWDRHDVLEDALAITFDDGYGNLLDHALPVLRKHGMRATVYALAGKLGGSNDWPGEPPEIPRLPLLDVAGLRTLQSAGWEIGSHGDLHSHLPALSGAALDREISGSKARLEDATGHPVTHFAYPYGEATPRVKELCRARYRAAAGVRLGFARSTDDRFDLPRIDMYYVPSARALDRLPGAAGRGYVWLRARGRDLRRALAGAAG
ncbi:MAG: polysaccharide deacetylase family protein [Acidobacteriota bacterium]